MNRHHLGAVCAVLTAALLTGCSATPAADATAGAGTTSPAAAPPDASVTCEAQLAINAVPLPNIDPDGPAPTPEDVRTWAAAVEPSFATVRSTAPAELAESLAVQARVLEAAGRGEPFDVFDPELTAAAADVDRWVHDTCGFQTLDVVNDGGAFGPVPATLRPGPVAVEFTNAGDPATAGVVLLLGRVREGAEVTVADLESGRVAFDEVVDIAAAAQAMGPEPGYSTGTLTPGRYILASPLGAPPEFSGVLYAELTVS